jgi:hypothetical protein|eukprot:scaffold4011_cov115-Alexandrium_tamarense.AAC.19
MEAVKGVLSSVLKMGNEQDSVQKGNENSASHCEEFLSVRHEDFAIELDDRSLNVSTSCNSTTVQRRKSSRRYEVCWHITLAF